MIEAKTIEVLDVQAGASTVYDGPSVPSGHLWVVYTLNILPTSGTTSYAELAVIDDMGNLYQVDLFQDTGTGPAYRSPVIVLPEGWNVRVYQPGGTIAVAFDLFMSGVDYTL